jgi:hypothetical protein
MIPGKTYRHKSFIDVDMRVDYMIDDDGQTKYMEVTWINRVYGPVGPDTVTVKVEDLGNWEEMSITSP